MNAFIAKAQSSKVTMFSMIEYYLCFRAFVSLRNKL